MDRSKLPEQSLKVTPALEKNRAEAVTRKPVVIAESPARQREGVESSDQTTAEQALHMAEIHRLMKDQIEEPNQAAVEETNSRRKEPARDVREKVTRSIKRTDNAARTLRVEHGDDESVVAEEQPADGNHIGSKELIRLEASVTLPNVPFPEDIPAATTEIFSVFDEETPLLAFQSNTQAPTQVSEAVGQDQPDLDRWLLDFQGLKSSTDRIEPYAPDGRPLDIFYEGEEPLVIDEALPHRTGLVEIAALPQYEAVFDDEVMNTFEQLLELVYSELEQHAETVELIDDQVILINPETPEPIEPNAFEEFVTSIAKPELIPDLDTIIASANEQTLEETFVQLSLYLTETSPDTENPVIQETLKNLAELLSRSSSDDSAEAEKVTITPELTQQLLTLLQVVGYDNPREVLLAFVKQHDFEFLLQAIRHLSQLFNDDDRQELLHKQATIIALTSDEPLTARLGKAILSLMTRFKVSEVAISDL